MDSDAHLYVSRPEAGSWADQEASCKRSEGTLITLASKEEEDSVRPYIVKKMRDNISSFWIGLNMCLDYKGKNPRGFVSSL